MSGTPFLPTRNSGFVSRPATCARCGGEAQRWPGERFSLCVKCRIEAKDWTPTSESPST